VATNCSRGSKGEQAMRRSKALSTGSGAIAQSMSSKRGQDFWCQPGFPGSSDQAGSAGQEAACQGGDQSNQ